MRRNLTENPHKTFLLVVSGLGGLIGVFMPGRISTSINAAFPPGLQVTWFSVLALTSVAALFGMSRPPSVAGYLWERVALLMQGVLLIAYGFAVVGLNGFNGTGGPLLFYGGFAAANFARAWTLTQILGLIPDGEEGSADG